MYTTFRLSSQNGPSLRTVLLIEQMPHLFALGPQVRRARVHTSARHGTRSTTCTPAFSTASTFSGLFDISRTAFSPKYCRIAPGSCVVAQVAIEAQPLVGFHRVGALILQLIGAQLVEQPDAAAFLMFVDQQPAPSSAMARSAISSCARQSQRRL